MAYTQKAGLTVIDAFGKCQGILEEAVSKVGLLVCLGTDGFILADQDDAAGRFVALEKGAIGDTIWMAIAAILEAPPTESAGVWSAGTLAASTDIGSTLYLDDDGQVALTAGTVAQVVGTVLSVSQMMLCPNTYLTGTSQTLSGALSVGTTLAVTGATTLTSLKCSTTLEATGASTLTGAVALNGGATVATGKDFTMTKGNIIFTKGGVQSYVRTITATDSILVNDEVIVCNPAASTTLTLPDLATAGVGKSFTIIHNTVAQTMIVVPAGTDKLIGADGVATYVKATDDKGLDVRWKFTAIAAALWMMEELGGTAATMA